MTDENRIDRFVQRYTDGDIPWDTGITPPEIVAIVEELPAGRAIDMGCGTGTNVKFLAERGWQADGVDFVPQAIAMARPKLAHFSPQQASVYCHDVTRLDTLEGLRPPYDLVVDIGCGHNLPHDAYEGYARDVAGLLKPGGVMMLYAHSPTPDRVHGWTPADVHRLFTPYFDIVSEVCSADTTNHRPSAWFRMAKRG